MDTLKKKNGNRYLVFDFTDKNKEVLKKYAELSDEIKILIKTINGGTSDKYKNISLKSNIIQIKLGL